MSITATPIEAARLERVSNFSPVLAGRSCAGRAAGSLRLIRRTPLRLSRSARFSIRSTIASTHPGQLIDYIRPLWYTLVDFAPAKDPSLAENSIMSDGCHGATDMSPVCMLPRLHFD